MVVEEAEPCPSDMYNQPTIYESFCIHQSSSVTVPTVHTSKSAESFSVFGDTDCGQPMVSQRLIIDFTPDPKLDSQESQKKCCEFWEFINNNPNIQHLMALSDPNLKSWTTKTTTESSTSSVVPNQEVPSDEVDLERTAISMLEICEGKDLIKRAFEPEMCLSHCSVSQQDVETKPSTSKGFAKLATSAQSMASSSPEVVDLCKMLAEWDKNNPKSMDPPGHIIEHRPILQRVRDPPI